MKQTTKKMTNKNKLYIAIGIIVLNLIIIGWFSNFINYTYNVVRCGGLPVETENFISRHVYRLPGDKGYGIKSSSEYHFCTENEVGRKAGYFKAR